MKHLNNQPRGLIIGNSRLHWVIFNQKQIITTYHTPHLSPTKIAHIIDSIPTLYLASVVPDQTPLWTKYPSVKIITLDHIPINNLYPTLGIDRALALWGAATKWGWPILVIDSGTALTITGGHQGSLIGGAIIPNINLQFQALDKGVAADLPQINPTLGPIFALNTAQAISSGIIYTILAGVKEFISQWNLIYPNSKTIITGGTGKWLYQSLQNHHPDIITNLSLEPELIFWGLVNIIPPTNQPT